MPVYKEIEAVDTVLQEHCKLKNSEILRVIWLANFRFVEERFSQKNILCHGIFGKMAEYNG